LVLLRHSSPFFSSTCIANAFFSHIPTLRMVAAKRTRSSFPCSSVDMSATSRSFFRGIESGSNRLSRSL